MEAKEETVTLKTALENDEVNAGTQGTSSTHDEFEGDVLSQDYSNFTKQEFVDLLRELATQNDFKKTDAILKEAKSRFDEILDKERSEALKKFVDEGGDPNDFEFRHDAVDTAFEANYKLLRDRKTEHFKGLEDQKNDNFRKKNLLLEELRKLTDGEDDRHSFDKLKEIQQQWKVIGTVPAAHAKPLWASYHALMDRFYDNRNIYFELKELDRKKNLEAKIELAVRAEKLSSVERIGEAVRELNELHEEYKHIGPVAREEKDAVWDRFKKASDAIYARRDAFVTNLNQEWAKNLETKDAIINEITSYAAFQSDRIKEWNQKTAEVIAIQKKWETVGPVPRAKAKENNKRFWTAFKNFFNSKGVFFKKLDESRVKNLELKKELVAQAEALKTNPDWDKTANALKNLQVKWKEIGPVPEKMREKIYQEFKAACDYFFDQRRVKFEEADKEQADNLHKKEAILSEIERMVNEKTGTLGQLKEMQRSFQSIGFVPRNAVNSIKARFNAATDKFIASLEQVSQEDKDKFVLETQLENIKTDPDAAQKIYQKEQALRKKIQKAENDVATLRNNLEFFGRSKNAEKMKADFTAQIDASNAEVAQLKAQLKMLRQAAQ
ncbi:MAG: DUF349 domain-containing protein [Cyclobacteriaceae bacterium]|nr:DUF349 domain-containing protein [Cyclobacteriaceae bacterium]